MFLNYILMLHWFDFIQTNGKINVSAEYFHFLNFIFLSKSKYLQQNLHLQPKWQQIYRYLRFCRMNNYYIYKNF